jgi:hypothetical protein
VADDISVRVAPDVLANGTTGAPLTGHVVNRTWFISEAVNGGSLVDLSLQWTGTQELSGFDRTQCYVMAFTGGSWGTAINAPAVGSDPFTQVRRQVSSFSPFAVQTQPLKPGIYPNPARKILNVVVDLPTNRLLSVRVYDATGHLMYRRSELLSAGLNLHQIDVSRFAAGVYVVKASIFQRPEFVVGKFVKE